MYFDPGIGSLLIQALIGIFAVGGGYLVLAKTKIKDFFTGKKHEKASESSHNDDEL